MGPYRPLLGFFLKIMQFSKLTVMGSDRHFAITVAAMWEGKQEWRGAASWNTVAVIQVKENGER